MTTDETQPAAGGFAGLGLCQPLLDAIARQGWPEPTPIQRAAIPVVLSGQDLFGVAQTGTGKTAAFALPILHQLSALPPAPPLQPYCVVLAPTRELVQQIADQFELLAAGLNLRIISAYGGTSDRPQTAALASGVEIIAGAPGRVFDLMKQGYLQYASLKFTVLDEADRMFDMGFIDEIRNILNRMPARRQTLMFSATLPQVVKKLAEDYLFYPEEIRIGTTGPPKELNHEMWPVRSDRDKEQALTDLLGQDHECVLVFCRTKLGAAQLARMLSRWGEKVAAIHGDRMQSERERALDAFRAGRVRVLVGTDVASRGLDIEGIDLVLNYDVPRDPEDYVHRVGRTARAKRSGIAVTFVQPDEERYVKRIEQFIKAGVPRRAEAGKAPREKGGRAQERAGGAELGRGETESRDVVAAGDEPRKRRSRGGRGRGRSGEGGGQCGAGQAPNEAGLGQRGAQGQGAQERQRQDVPEWQRQPEAAGNRAARPQRPADDDDTYIEDERAYAPGSLSAPGRGSRAAASQHADTTSAGAEAEPADGAPRKRRRGKRGGRGRKRDGGDGAGADAPAE